MRRVARAVIVAALATAAVAGLAGTASAAPAEDGTEVSSGYYSDPTPVSEYERRLDKPGACRIARATFAKWRPGDPPVPESVSKTMLTCLRTP